MGVNRDIKFRGYTKELKRFVSGDLLHLEKNFVKYFVIIDWSQKNANVKVESYSIGQFTGLKDKNGKEIYEGDIVRSEVYEMPGSVVEWEYEHWAPFQYYMSNIEEDFEVVGNILQNPELLIK